MPPVTSRKRPRAPRERPNDVPARPRSLSGASPERLGSAPRRARALQGGPGASRGRIGVHFGGQIGHKRCIFRCFSHLCLQTSEHAAHSYRACFLHSFQSFFGHGVWITAKNPCWHSLAAFHDHPAARRYVRSTSAASRRECRACQTVISFSSYLPASKACFKGKTQNACHKCLPLSLIHI